MLWVAPFDLFLFFFTVLGEPQVLDWGSLPVSALRVFGQLGGEGGMATKSLQAVLVSTLGKPFL